jgi:hypothetical protein
MLAGLSNHLGTREQVDGYVLLCCAFLCQPSSPRLELVNPDSQRVPIDSKLSDFESATPTVIDQRFHWHFDPLPLAILSVHETRRENIVTVGQYVSLDDDPVTDNPLGREAATVNLGSHGFYDNAQSAVMHTGIF